MSERYFLKTDVHPWKEVTFDEFLVAEKNAGFRTKTGEGTLATGGFSGHGVSGRIMYPGRKRGDYDWDPEFEDVAFPRTFNQHQATKGMVATLGHPANEILIVKGEEVWRYVHNGKVVDDEDFRAGWDLYTPKEVSHEAR